MREQETISIEKLDKGFIAQTTGGRRVAFADLDSLKNELNGYVEYQVRKPVQEKGVHRFVVTIIVSADERETNNYLHP